MIATGAALVAQEGGRGDEGADARIACAAVEVGPGPLALLGFLVGHRGRGGRGPTSWRVVDLDAGTAAREALQTDEPLEPLCRCDLARIAVRIGGELRVVDLRAGEVRRIAAAPTFLGVRGAELLFVTADHRLAAAAWTGVHARRAIGERPFAEFSFDGRDHVLAVPDAGDEVWLVDVGLGTERRVGAIPATTASELRLALSPDGRRVAVGRPNGALLILDVDGRAEPVLVDGLRLALPPESSSSPRLEVAWESDDVLVTSETRGGRFAVEFAFVRRNATDGAIVDERPYGRELSHHRPLEGERQVAHLFGWWPFPARGRETHGWFDGGDGELRYRGGDDVLARRDDRLPSRCDVELTPGDRFALVMTGGDGGRVEVIDGERRARRTVDGSGDPVIERWWIGAAR